MTRQKCKSTGKRHIARARSEQCTLPLQANMQHLAELPQRGDADLSLARRQDMKVPHGQLASRAARSPPRRESATLPQALLGLDAGVAIALGNGQDAPRVRLDGDR